VEKKTLNNGTKCHNISDGLTESSHKDPAMAYHLFCIEYLYTSVIMHQSGWVKLRIHSVCVCSSTSYRPEKIILKHNLLT